jgi:hypothetical protein
VDVNSIFNSCSFAGRKVALALVVATLCAVSQAQTWPPAPSAPVPTAPEPQQPVTVRETPLNLLRDQGAIWSSPARIRDNDFHYLVPLGLMVTLAVTTDHEAMSEVVSQKKSLNDRSTQASNALLSPFLAAPVVMCAAGHLAGSDHARETGILSGEAMVNGLVVEQGMKLIFLRERPAVDSAKGKFFQTSVGVDGSFPSNHSILAWSGAAVLAEEYPSRLNQIALYGAATGVSLTRVLGQQHFPSDVLVGSAFGWMIGHYVYKKHHRWHNEIFR